MLSIFLLFCVVVTIVGPIWLIALLIRCKDYDPNVPRVRDVAYYTTIGTAFAMWTHNGGGGE